MSDPFNPHPPEAPGDGQDSWQEVMGGFPRHLTTQLIDDRNADRSKKEHLAVWLVSLALVVFALAFPQERLLATIHTDGWRGIGIGALGWNGMATQFGLMFDVTPELFELITAALCYGFCLPLALSIARQLGIGFKLALPTTLLVLLSPGVWSAATTATTGTPALLLGLGLMRELWREGPCRPQIVLALWFAGATLDVGFAWTLPAVLWAIGSRGKFAWCSWKTQLNLAVLVLSVLTLALLGLLVGMAEGSSSSASVLQSYLFDLTGNWSSPLTWAAASLPTLGLSLVGLAGLFFLRRNHAESAPPRWLLAWCLVPAVVCALAGPVPFGFSFLWLIPPALIGCLDLVARQDEADGKLWGAAGLGIQGLILFGALWFVSSSDPLQEWREQASANLNPGDWVLTTDPEHRYLLEKRWGLETTLVSTMLGQHGLRERVIAENARGRRVVLDHDPESPLPEPLQQALDGLPAPLELQAIEPPQSPSN